MEIMPEPSDPQSVMSYVKKINELAASLVVGNDSIRIQLVEEARSLARALETPRETMCRHCLAQPCAMAALTLGVDVGLFKVMAKGNGSSKSSADLANKVGVDPIVVVRILRHLTAMGYTIQTATDEYKPTRFTTALCHPNMSASYIMMPSAVFSAHNHFHKFMKKTGYKMPNSMAGGALQYAYKTKLGLFGHLQANPPYGELFSHFMAGYHEGRPSWMDPGFFPIQEKLIDGARHGDGEVFLVDIAGATGYDLEEYLQKHPSPPGRLVLQDLPAVIGQIDNLREEIERMSYDFFTEQPLKGSRVYFMHYILHDWSDETCLKILARVTEAMEPGYSKFLINENVIPSRNAHWDTTALDMQLMITLSSRERTEEDWNSLLKAGGLKICKIWSVSGGCECLIECELARTNPATGFD